jgi:hypothetical protein
MIKKVIKKKKKEEKKKKERMCEIFSLIFVAKPKEKNVSDFEAHTPTHFHSQTHSRVCLLLLRHSPFAEKEEQEEEPLSLSNVFRKEMKESTKSPKPNVITNLCYTQTRNSTQTLLSPHAITQQLHLLHTYAL